MPKKIKTLLSLIIFSTISFQQHKGFAAVGDSSYMNSGTQKIQNSLVWETDYAAALKKAKEEDKSIFVMFTATWCGVCKVMERETLSDPTVKKLLEPFIAVKVYENGKIKNLSRVKGYPTFAFVDSYGYPFHMIHGYKTVGDFRKEAGYAVKYLQTARMYREKIESKYRLPEGHTKDDVLKMYCQYNIQLDSHIRNSAAGKASDFVNMRFRVESELLFSWLEKLTLSELETLYPEVFNECRKTEDLSLQNQNDLVRSAFYIFKQNKDKDVKNKIVEIIFTSWHLDQTVYTYLNMQFENPKTQEQGIWIYLEDYKAKLSFESYKCDTIELDKAEMIFDIFVYPTDNDGNLGKGSLSVYLYKQNGEWVVKSHSYRIDSYPSAESNK